MATAAQGTTEKKWKIRGNSSIGCVNDWHVPHIEIHFYNMFYVRKIDHIPC